MEVIHPRISNYHGSHLVRSEIRATTGSSEHSMEVTYLDRYGTLIIIRIDVVLVIIIRHGPVH